LRATVALPPRAFALQVPERQLPVRPLAAAALERPARVQPPLAQLLLPEEPGRFARASV
jgi:hypothetical protein